MNLLRGLASRGLKTYQADDCFIADSQWQNLPTLGGKYVLAALKSETLAESSDDPVLLIGHLPVYVSDCPHPTGTLLTALLPYSLSSDDKLAQ